MTSLPTLSGLPSGVTTGFHCVADASGDRAHDSVSVESGKTYRFSAYLYLDSNTASGLRLSIHDAIGGTEAETGIFATLDAWTRIEVSVVADATETWQFRVRQAGAGAADWYFTSVSIKDVTEELTPTLTVTPRVLLSSG